MNELNQQPATNNRQPKYQCRHIFTDGHRCGSICLRGEPFCYYHHTTRKPAPRQSLGKKSSFDLPLPEDRSAIQASIGIILQKIASNDLDPRRAGLLLYGLQIASLNLPKQQPTRRRRPRTGPRDHHPSRTRHPGPTNRDQRREKLLAARLLEELTQPKPAVLPQIQATADTRHSRKHNQQRVTNKLQPPLKQPSLRQIANQPKVSGQKVIPGQGRQRSPLHVIEDAVVQVPIELVDDEELQVDSATIAVLMADAGDPAPDGCRDAELLVQFADQRLFSRLPGLDFASGELPFEAHRLVRTPLTDKHFRVAVAR